jgi:tRNA (cmo5U34)-methyltransferase
MKNKDTGNFDRVAPIYDTLSFLIFGNAIRKAQHAFVDSIYGNSVVLVLGGGTGAFLPALRSRITTGQILFVDSSAGMIAQASRRVSADTHLTFLVGTLEDVPAGFVADVVITHFFFDLFDDRQLDQVVRKIDVHTKPGSAWIACDFVKTKSMWQRILLKSMYLFFRISARLKNRSLPNWQQTLRENGYAELDRQEFYHRFIQACIFRKTN